VVTTCTVPSTAVTVKLSASVLPALSRPHSLVGIVENTGPRAAVIKKVP
jgi:hypothetical protein